jgi:hypothetical protein
MQSLRSCGQYWKGSSTIRGIPGMPSTLRPHDTASSHVTQHLLFLLQLDGKLPNLALMRLAPPPRTVTWTSPPIACFRSLAWSSLSHRVVSSEAALFGGRRAPAHLRVGFSFNVSAMDGQTQPRHIIQADMVKVAASERDA